MRIEILWDKVPEELKEEFKENKIFFVDKLLHFRLNEKSNVINTFNKLPIALKLIGKYSNESIA